MKRKVAAYILAFVLGATVLRLGEAGWKHSRTPRIEAECSRMRPGLSRDDVFRILQERVPPGFVRESSDEIVAIRADGSCVIQLGPHQSVQRAYVDKNNTAWPPYNAR